MTDLDAIRARDHYAHQFPGSREMGQAEQDRRALLAYVDELRSRLAEAEAAIEAAGRCLVMSNNGAAEALTILRGFKQADSASAVQPERCCLDYPRCDCNSPPEPDDDWLCFQRPAQPKVTP